MPLKELSTVVVPVRDQDAALAFYTDVLGLEKISDFTYDSGERWLEVAPPGQIISLCLVASERAGVETGIALCSDDVPGDLERFRERGARVDDALSGAGRGRGLGRRAAGRVARRSSACTTRTGTRC